MALTDRRDARTVGVAAASGTAAYVLGYLLVYVTQRRGVEERLSAFNFMVDLFGSDPIPAWQGVGWLFYNAHFVDTEIPGFGGTRVENFIAASDDGTLTLLYLVPPVLLLGAGFAAAFVADVDDLGDGVPIGALVTVAYLPLAVVGAVAFAYSIGDGSIRPDLVTAVLLAGVVYPALFGAVGGALAGVVAGDS
ncbi:transporter [Halorubrum sp. DTA98]|uniref:transporter n=1 Tax=Halorubrum sp. DTA98 TaxID=3402163 RepID=UPI003AAE2506